MERKILIKKAFEDGNRKLFNSKKKTYKSLFELSKKISELTGLSENNVFSSLRRWSEEETFFNYKKESSVIIIDSFFIIFDLNQDDYIVNAEVVAG